MYNNAPKNYKCPICLAIKGVENDETLIRQSDIIFNDDLVIAFISSFFIGKNPGHVIISPNRHYENIYHIPDEYLHRIAAISKKVSKVLKQEYKCDGIMILQNNEPASGQHAFHYHCHVFPRYKNDEIHKYMANKRNTTEEERIGYSIKLKGKI